MTENYDRINQLLEKLENLLKRQDSFSREIDELRNEINILKTTQVKGQFEEKKEIKTDQPVTDIGVKYETVATIYQKHQAKAFKEQPKTSALKTNTSPKIKSDIEKFIGENLINKIGIAITIIGVAIGAKYSIEHQLISPMTRIIVGYLMGLGLLGFGIKLKKNYENYSAVLVSGAMAILYFITYAAYSFYSLFPQLFAFTLMVVFTAITVVAAINYNKQVIAHIGLVGAYAVPFLLSEGSGKVAILFSYMAIINMGILLITLKKYWISLYYSSFLLTWLIFFSWFYTKYQQTEHFVLALIFLCIFFATFYFIFLAYKLVQKKKFGAEDIILLLANSFIFYSIGYSILNTPNTPDRLGLFTLGNAIIHLVASIAIYRQKLADRNLFFLVAGLVLVFITIAIPVQLDGSWVTLLWAGEAALLFWIGRTKTVPFYEKLSYLLMFLAFFSIAHDWLNLDGNYYPTQTGKTLKPILNINFLTSLLFVAFFGFINYVNNIKKYATPLLPEKVLNPVIRFSIPAILLIVIYYSFRIEISNYWNQLYIDSLTEIKKDSQGFANNDLNQFKKIWIINYSLLFFSIISFVNIYKFKNKNLGLVNLGLNTLLIIVFLSQGLYILSELRESYLNNTNSAHYRSSSFNIVIRYISFAFAGLMLYSISRYVKQDFVKLRSLNLNVSYDLLLYTSLLWIASSELITWMDIMKFSQSYKLGLSILWGLYALGLIGVGIWKKKKHLRIGAIVLFGITLLKLFFYDISHLDTIAKTIVFVSLGVLLLIISFLYNKYKLLISRENEN